MAVPAHLRVLPAAALPTLRMRVPAVRADLVATDAVRQRPGFVTARARKNVAARRRAVKVARLGVRADPSGRMRIARVEDVRAHAASRVTGVARLRRVTTRAASRLRLRFD